VNDRVCFKASFLRNTGQMTGEVAHMPGTAVEIKPLGEITNVRVRWDGEEGPKGVRVSNLSRVTTRGSADE
jgi:hypothetical protein